METAIKSLEKGAADKEIINKSTIVSLEDNVSHLQIESRRQMPLLNLI